jgi:hypothetical protein
MHQTKLIKRQEEKAIKPVNGYLNIASLSSREVSF